MSNYVKELNTTLTDAIKELTGIPTSKLKKETPRFIINHPLLLNITERQREKLEALKDFINLYNEAVYVNETTILNSSPIVGEYFKQRLQGITDIERFEVAFLNSQNVLIRTETMSTGTIDEAAVYPREILKAVIKYNAKSVILAHNHPGGSLKPSNADTHLTAKISEALKPINVKVFDHIIVGGNGYYSFAEQGLLY